MRIKEVIVVEGYHDKQAIDVAVEADCLLSSDQIRHRPVGMKSEVTTEGWLPREGPVAIGLTSGASTPDNLVGVIVTRLAEVANSPQVSP